MLKEILKEISNSNYISKSNIAVKLNINETLIEDAFSQLVRMGYIKEDENNDVNCSSSCMGCPYAKSCSKLPVKTVILTNKGKSLLKIK